MSKEIDFEKDFLVIGRKDGKFYNFHWYELRDYTLESFKKFVDECNEKNGPEMPRFEVITDPLVREICAYRAHASPLNDVISSAKEVQESIDNAREQLEEAIHVLNHIKGLD
ncbi:hypothetical protein FACS1894106_2690 [Spirochaetia bacterium]|nr:hypothetical protein FACS1894106_2690 [Spirochaetia bacterium]